MDAVRKIHKTGRLREYGSKTPVQVEIWNGKKEDFFGREKNKKDERVIGPKSNTFPAVDGWKIDGEEVRLDRLTIKDYTNISKLRQFKNRRQRRHGQQS